MCINVQGARKFKHMTQIKKKKILANHNLWCTHTQYKTHSHYSVTSTWSAAAHAHTRLAQIKSNIINYFCIKLFHLFSDAEGYCWGRSSTTCRGIKIISFTKCNMYFIKTIKLNLPYVQMFPIYFQTSAEKATYISLYCIFFHVNTALSIWKSIKISQIYLDAIRAENKRFFLSSSFSVSILSVSANSASYCVLKKYPRQQIKWNDPLSMLVLQICSHLVYIYFNFLFKQACIDFGWWICVCVMSAVKL